MALSFQIEICNRTKSSFLATSLYKKVIFTKNWVTRSCRPSDEMLDPKLHVYVKLKLLDLIVGCHGYHYAIKLNRADPLVRKWGCNKNFRSWNMLTWGIKFQCNVNAKSEILLQHVAQWSLFTCKSIVMTHGPRHKSGRKMTPYGFDSEFCALKLWTKSKCDRSIGIFRIFPTMWVYFQIDFIKIE